MISVPKDKCQENLHTGSFVSTDEGIQTRGLCVCACAHLWGERCDSKLLSKKEKIKTDLTTDLLCIRYPKGFNIRFGIPKPAKAD